MNQVFLTGRAVADPEVTYTQGGVPVARMRVAVDRRFKNASGERETDFIPVTAWRKLAELCQQYVHKGMLIGVTGSLRQQRYTNQAGEKRVAYEVVADQVEFLSRKPSGPENGEVEAGAEGDAPF
ncbi:MAG: single-stranded DNA-binding protein [bacterium]